MQAKLCTSFGSYLEIVYYLDVFYKTIFSISSIAGIADSGFHPQAEAEIFTDNSDFGEFLCEFLLISIFDMEILKL